ncbi:SCO5717 family growth-regulating ATPase, partial [Actinacidiphila rubida]
MSSDRDENRVGGPAPVEDSSESDYTGEFSLGPRLPAWYMQDSSGGSSRPDDTDDATDTNDTDDTDGVADDVAGREPESSGSPARGAAGHGRDAAQESHDPRDAAPRDRGGPAGGGVSASPGSWSASSVPLIPQPTTSPEPDQADDEPAPSVPSASSVPLIPQPTSPESGGSRTGGSDDEPAWSVSSVPVIPRPTSAEPDAAAEA